MHSGQNVELQKEDKRGKSDGQMEQLASECEFLKAEECQGQQSSSQEGLRDAPL